MRRWKYCHDCHRPGVYYCDPCRRERDRLYALHGNQHNPPMRDPGREWRLRLYTLLADARRPLFAGHR